ncbi:hypothetical protein [Oceanicaulis sp.]
MSERTLIFTGAITALADCVLTPGPAFDAAGLDANALLTACEAAL